MGSINDDAIKNRINDCKRDIREYEDKISHLQKEIRSLEERLKGLEKLNSTHKRVKDEFERFLSANKNEAKRLSVLSNRNRFAKEMSSGMLDLSGGTDARRTVSRIEESVGVINKEISRVREQIDENRRTIRLLNSNISKLEDKIRILNR